jgi:hypothetical protein
MTTSAGTVKTLESQVADETSTAVGKEATAGTLAIAWTAGMKKQQYEHINSRPDSSTRQLKQQYKGNWNIRGHHQQGRNNRWKQHLQKEC